MNNSDFRRFGDAFAPRWTLRWVGAVRTPILVLVGILLIVAYASVIVRLIGGGGGATTLASITGMVLGLGVIVAGVGIWHVLWLPVVRAVRALERTNGGWVIGARVPRLAMNELAPRTSILNAAIRPQNVVLVCDAAGLVIFNTAPSPVKIVALSWPDIESVIPAEYVEGGRAYEGIAILMRGSESSFVLQFFNTSRWIKRFPSGEQLVELADQLEARRSPSL